MTLDQILDDWKKDSAIDSTELGVESIKIPELHSKYMQIYFSERQRLRGYEFQMKEVYLRKYEYYNDRMSQEELEQYSLEPFVKRLMKNEVDHYIDADKDINNVKMKITAQNEKISLLEEIVKNLNQRNFQIRNAIEWAKFTNGTV